MWAKAKEPVPHINRDHRTPSTPPLNQVGEIRAQLITSPPTTSRSLLQLRESLTEFFGLPSGSNRSLDLELGCLPVSRVRIQQTKSIWQLQTVPHPPDNCVFLTTPIILTKNPLTSIREHRVGVVVGERRIPIREPLPHTTAPLFFPKITGCSDERSRLRLVDVPKEYQCRKSIIF